jgi:hypothetical protein
MIPEQSRALAYLEKKGTLAPATRLREQLSDAVAAIERALDDVAPEQRDVRPAEGKWSAHDILDHLVVSHEPAVTQFASLLDGVSVPDAIAAGLRSGARPSWSELRERMSVMHAGFLRLIDDASDDFSLDAKAGVEMVVKVNGEPLHWREQLDWKAFIQAIRMHTLEHREQLQRALATNAAVT